MGTYNPHHQGLSGGLPVDSDRSVHADRSLAAAQRASCLAASGSTAIPATAVASTAAGRSSPQPPTLLSLPLVTPPPLPAPQDLGGSPLTYPAGPPAAAAAVGNPPAMSAASAWMRMRCVSGALVKMPDPALMLTPHLPGTKPRGGAEDPSQVSHLSQSTALIDEADVERGAGGDGPGPTAAADDLEESEELQCAVSGWHWSR